MIPLPDGIWRCERGHQWSHPPAMTQCPVCGTIENIKWLNWPEVEAAVAARKAERMAVK